MKNTIKSVVIILLLFFNIIAVLIPSSEVLAYDILEVNERWNIALSQKIIGSPTFADLDSDGLFEIIIASVDSNLYCIDKDGVFKWIFPIPFGISNTPCIADIDQDGYLEIIVGSYSNRLCCLNYNGTIKWDVTTSINVEGISLTDIEGDNSFDLLLYSDEGVACFSNQGVEKWCVEVNIGGFSEPRVHLADVNGDGKMEVLCYTYNDILYLISYLGTVTWSKSQIGKGYTTVFAYDLDGDNKDEIYLYGMTYIACLYENGITKWQERAYHNLYGPPIITNADGDGDKEIVCTGSIAVPAPPPYIFYYYPVYVHYSKTGIVERIIEVDDLFESWGDGPAITDVDNDGVFDYFFAEHTNSNGKVNCITEDGDFRFTRYVSGEVPTNPCIIDLDADGIVEIIVASNDYWPLDRGYVSCFEFPDIAQSGKSTHHCEGNSVFRTGFPDTDGDMLDDLTEEFYDVDKWNKDSDYDGLEDGFEVLSCRTKPNSNDTDLDGFEDGWEIEHGLDPTINNMDDDEDDDGLTNFEEVILGTDMFLNDTDFDNIIDGDEVHLYFTNPLLNDTDFDELYDYDEIFVHMTNATFNDTDYDIMPDGWEVLTGLNPLFNDSAEDPDNDTLTNLEEYFYSSHPFLNDTDFDTLNDSAEVYIYFTNPSSEDTDSDGLTDADELFIHTTIPYLNDTDSDGMFDGWEVLYSLDPLINDSTEDGDSDGLNNLEEFLYDANPTLNDSDADGLFDGPEVFTFLTLPNNNDTDSDGLLDGEEIITYFTNATNPDTDYDGMDDYYEIQYSLNPTVNDSYIDYDNDGLSNIEEFNLGTIPRNNDTESDGMPDGWEYLNELDPLLDDSGNDPDNDTLTNLEEYLLGTSPILADTDSDGMDDEYEVFYGLDPLHNDAGEDLDDDGLNNLSEYEIGTLPDNNDTDGDGMPDGWEYDYTLNPLLDDDANADPDNDGLTNLQEYEYKTNPRVADTDGDGQPDGEEVEKGFNPLDPYSNSRGKNQVILVVLGMIFAVLIVVVPRYIISFRRIRRENILKEEEELAASYGFQSIEEMEAIQSIGFKTKVEYDTLKSLGFETKEDYLDDKVSTQLHKVSEMEKKLKRIEKEVTPKKDISKLEMLLEEINILDASLTLTLKITNEYILAEFGGLRESWVSSIDKVQQMKRSIRSLKAKIRKLIDRA